NESNCEGRVPQHSTVLLESKQFPMELTRLFQSVGGRAASTPALKQCDGQTEPAPRKASVEGVEPSDNKCLSRATDGKKRISTGASSKDVNKLRVAYSNLLRAHMDWAEDQRQSKSKKSKAAGRRALNSLFLPNHRITYFSFCLQFP
ncbi:signal recognition particle 14 kDa protein-like, partial [Marmota marmota marmota]|uniref:signal recognition particle 14 kDa protein-like n=1 Tax=Marmota marmota marmota TaxID=9994 RepID=UPI0007623E60